MRRAALLALALALLVVPSAGAVGLADQLHDHRRAPRRQRLVPQRSDGSDHRHGRDVDTTCPSGQDVLARAATRCSTALRSDGHRRRSVHLQFNIDTDAPSVTGATPSRAASERLVQSSRSSFSFSGIRRNVRHRIVHHRFVQRPRLGSASVSGTCRDNAGNVSAASTRPTEVRRTTAVSPCAGSDATAARAHAVRLQAPTRRRDRRVQAATYSGPTQRDVTRWLLRRRGTARRHRRAQVRRDPPSAAAKSHGHPTSTGGTRSRSRSFSGADALGLANCTRQTYAAPDNGSASVEGACRDNAGNTTTASAPLKYDATAPNFRTSRSPLAAATSR